MTLTRTQQKALHLGFRLIADALNEAGLDMRKTLKPTVAIPWTAQNVKNHLYRPVMEAMLGKKSTTELEKVGEIDEVWDTVMRFLGENHSVEYIPFPHDPEKQKSDLLEGMKIDVRNDENYPELIDMPKI